MIKKPGIQTIGEEIANSVSHGIGALLSMGGTAVLLVLSCIYGDALTVVSSAVYGFSLIVLYTMSTLYHALTNEKAKKVMQIFDHCSIFLLILGSYAPICLAQLGDKLGFAIFAVNLVLTICGITLNAIDVRKWHKLSMVLYILMGWSIVFAARSFIALTPVRGLVLLLAGGLCYTAGIIFYKNKTVKFMHSIWHIFVLAGSVLQYFFILFYIVLYR